MIWKLLIVLVIVLLVFGPGRISGVMGDLGKGIKSFKDGLNGNGSKPDNKEEK